MYSLLELHDLETSAILSRPLSPTFWACSCGLFTKSIDRAKTVMLLEWALLYCYHSFLFAPSPLWFWDLLLEDMPAAWPGGLGYFKAFTPQQERLKTCADVLIISM